MKIILTFIICLLLPMPGYAQQVSVDVEQEEFSLEQDTQPNPSLDDFSLDIQLPNRNQFTAKGDAALAFQAWEAGDYSKARVLAAVAGADGDPQGQLLFGILLDRGFGGRQEPVNAVKWYQEAAANGQMDAWLALAGMAFDNRGGLSVSDGRGFLELAAKAGLSEAMIALGRAYASGHGGPLDEAQAQRWFRAAIAVGANAARLALADLLLTQNKDAEALALYETAVFGGSVEAAWKAGILQADPESSVYAPKKAGLQLQTAATAGNLSAMTAYGLFLAGGTPALPAQAARWFRKAAEAGETEGQYLYALSLAKGEGVMKDRSMAYEWALRASFAKDAKPEYTKLSEVLRLALPPTIRDMVHARAKMPLLIARQTKPSRLTD